MIIDIRVDRIIPHPKNPRRDLGDLTELCESIKQNGILQNLTVIEVTPDKTKAVASVEEVEAIATDTENEKAEAGEAHEETEAD